MLDYEWMFYFYLIIWFISCSVYAIYIHRAHAHGSITVSSNFGYFARTWLWYIGFWYPGDSVRSFVAGHRKHHATSDTVDDPHSPLYYSKQELFFTQEPSPTSPAYYLTPDEIEKWASDVPIYTDWLEHQFAKYSNYRYPVGGILVLIMFGVWGPVVGCFLLFFIQILLRSHNYLSHTIGYRNRPAKGADRSRNIFPIGLLFFGEELAANHHDDTTKAKFSEKWWEFDLTWGIIVILKFFGLVKLNSTKYYNTGV
jgi:stearoyl-CoA desaturase (delta-9 desaturase)